eukprot:TRINITY_DN25974_c0_g1_i1.p1 TRINITY_DN25974_c0_g1~~TRINITY_DN25974_c0_g1_i1.p1  ORF type:complete len:580 (+),score=175.62 TRINITY_DN25974_c0_g1_i1:114-1853(+)
MRVVQQPAAAVRPSAPARQHDRRRVVFAALTAAAAAGILIPRLADRADRVRPDPVALPADDPLPAAEASAAVADEPPPSSGRRRVRFPGGVAADLPASSLAELLSAAEAKARELGGRAAPGLDILWFTELRGGAEVRVEVDDVSWGDLPADAPIHATYKPAGRSWAFGEQGDGRDIDTTPLTEEQVQAGCLHPRRRYHVVVTATPATYEQWLCRVMYHWYKKAKAKDVCGEMGGFTRLLTGEPDWLMDEIPSVSVRRLDPGTHCNATGKNTCDLGFVVLNRPSGFKQYLDLLDSGKVQLKEKWVLLCEPDHFMLKAVPGIARGGFAFNYMSASPNTPQHTEVLPFLPYGYSPQLLPPGGPSPALLHIDDWRKVTPGWLENSFSLRRRYEAIAAYGWVLEMWGFISAAVQVDIDLKTDKWYQVEPCAVYGWNCIGKLHPTYTVDEWKRNASAGPYIAHITQAMDFQLDGRHGVPKNESTWKKDHPPWAWNKRHYSASYPPRNLTPPPTRADHLYAHLVTEMVNDASSSLPHWGRLQSGDFRFGRDTCLDENRRAGLCDGFRSAGMLERFGFERGPAGSAP